jgi:hypothetical protein
MPKSTVNQSVDQSPMSASLGWSCDDALLSYLSGVIVAYNSARVARVIGTKAGSSFETQARLPQ